MVSIKKFGEVERGERRRFKRDGDALFLPLSQGETC